MTTLSLDEFNRGIEKFAMLSGQFPGFEWSVQTVESAKTLIYEVSHFSISHARLLGFLQDFFTGGGGGGYILNFFNGGGVVRFFGQKSKNINYWIGYYC